MAKSSNFHKPRPSNNKNCFDEPAQRTKRSAAAEVPKRTIVTDPGLLNRTSYTNASVAIQHVKKGRAVGNTAALYMRSRLQEEFSQLGQIIQVHAGKVLFTGLLLLSSLTIGLKSVEFEDRIDRLWVVEGGRLAREANYLDQTLGVGAGGVNQMVIQTGQESKILTSEALLSHLRVMKRATRVTVQKHDITWQLADLCYKPSIPQTELPFVEQILDKLFPCAVITPLDCFWEGSKLLGPDFPVHVPLGGDKGSKGVSWPSLHPRKLFDEMSAAFPSFPLTQFKEFMKQAGISDGYQEKPCLNPQDPDCPSTAPNKMAGRAPDIGEELTGGCSSFATRYMRWPEELIVGGVEKNKSGFIRSAGALQSVVQLMGPRDMVDYWANTYKVHTLRWNLETAEEILSEWQAKFQEEIAREEGERFTSYSSLGLETIMKNFSSLSITNVALGYTIMIVYAGMTMYRLGDRVRSHAGLGVAGVLLVALTVAAGLGLAALAGLTFNASSTQILPFLALGLGVDHLFLLVHTFATQTATNIPCKDQVGEVLRKSGISVLTTSLCNMAAFLAAALIPIPAMRDFCCQAAMLIGLNLVSMLLLLPAMIALDVRRVFANKYDLMCCVGNTGGGEGGAEANNAKNERTNRRRVGGGGVEGFGGSTKDLMGGGGEEGEVSESTKCAQKLTISRFARDYYGKMVAGTPTKVAVLMVGFGLLGASAWGINRLEDGLDISDIVPRNTSVWRFLEAEDRYFGFYNMYAVTEADIEYPEQQQLIYEYHDSFVRVANIIKDDNGGLPEFWLSLFRSWLVRLQAAFDLDFAAGLIDEEGWKPEASDDAILAYKLLVQTGHVDFPVDKSLLRHARLVENGLINPSGFYNYLSAWYSNDAMAYSFSQASIVPTPKSWFSDRADYNLKIPKSKPIRFAQIPFLLKNLGDTATVVETIKQVREICDKYSGLGLPNFPSGLPFTFWEQYIGLRTYLLTSLAAALAAVFVVVAVMLMSPWAAAILTFVIGCLVGQILGAMGILGIKLSAVPAVIIILSIGLGVEFTLHILISFVGSLGSREVRTGLALEQMMAPVLHGAVSTALGVLMLAFSQFDFIIRYFFLVLMTLIVLGMFNGLVFFPVLLVILGPPAHLASTTEDPLALPPLTPQPSPARFKAKPPKISSSSRPPPSSSRPRRHGSDAAAAAAPRRHNSDASLSTIAEETHSHHSSSSSSGSTTNSCDSYSSSSGSGDPQAASMNGTSVFLEPHITVETSSVPSVEGGSGSGQVTKVTATAKFKLELTHNGGGGESRPTSRRSRRSAADPLRSSGDRSGDSSLVSSLSSDGGFSEK